MALADAVTVYLCVGPTELAQLAESGYRALPPRSPGQPIVLVGDERGVRAPRRRCKVALSWVRFAVTQEFVARYSGRPVSEELWLSPEALDDLNRSIVGSIEVIATFEPT